MKNYLEIVQQWKNNNQTIVFTNGCFDILHKGHIALLEEAKKLGDKLIVGLNSDNSIKINKGEDRPINNISIRKKALKELNLIDLLIVFDEKTPEKLLFEIRPDILFKGSDYTVEYLNNECGGKYAKKIILFDRLPNLSTTKIIKERMMKNGNA